MFGIGGTLDGGLATALQKKGLPPYAPVDTWMLTRPEAVEEAHRSFVQAGASHLLAGTFRMLPHLTPQWAELVEGAVTVALRAAGHRATVWASIGPASTATQSWTRLDFHTRQRQAEGWGTLAERCKSLGVSGIVLETFTDPLECVHAVLQIRSVLGDFPLVASLVPREDGRLWDGAYPSHALAALRNAGANYVGFNCASPVAIEAALQLSGGADWAKPSMGELTSSEWVAAGRRIAASCPFFGGCCGVSSTEIAALRGDQTFQ